MGKEPLPDCQLEGSERLLRNARHERTSDIHMNVDGGIVHLMNLPDDGLENVQGARRHIPRRIVENEADIIRKYLHTQRRSWLERLLGNKERLSLEFKTGQPKRRIMVANHGIDDRADRVSSPSSA